MKNKVSYLIAAFAVYLITGLFLSFISLGRMDVVFLLGWSIGMTAVDYFILRKLRNTFKNKI